MRTGPAIHQIGRFDLKNEKHLSVPPTVLMDTLLLLMKNNVFHIWRQILVEKVGTEIGAEPAPPWATIFFGIHEEAVLAQFRGMLQLYPCFINDVLGIYLVDPNPAKYHRKWMAFKSIMHDYYGLEWIFEEQSKTVNFIDMRISIREYRIVTSLYEKSDEPIFIHPTRIHPSPRSVKRTRFWSHPSAS